jgi:hypothetical protein
MSSQWLSCPNISILQCLANNLIAPIFQIFSQCLANNLVVPHHHKKGVGTRYCSQSTKWVCGNRHDIRNNYSCFFPNFVSQVEKWSSDSSLIAIIKLGQIEASISHQGWEFMRHQQES